MAPPQGYTPWILYDDSVWDQRGSLALLAGTEAKPLSNLAAYEPSVPFVANESAASWEFDLGVAPTEETDSVVIVGTPPDTTSLEIFKDGSGPLAAGGGHVVAGASGKLLYYYRHADPGLVAKWRVDGARTSGGFYAGRMLVGKALELDGDLTNLEFEWIDDPGRLAVPESGVVWTGQAVGRRLLRYSFENLTEQSRDDLMDLYRRVGTWLPLAIVEESTSRLTVHGKLRRRPIARQTGTHYQATLEIEETAAG